MAIETLTFRVPGNPRPKGSTKAFMVAGRPRITSATKGLKEWENRIALFAPADRPFFHGPVTLRIRFLLPRPKSVRGADPHTTRPDLDKLVRAVGDALTGMFFRDDSQVVELHARKDYGTLDCATEITLKGETDAPIQVRRKARPHQ